MAELANMKCEVCRVGAPIVSDGELAQFRGQVPDWQVLEQDGVKRL